MKYLALLLLLCAGCPFTSMGDKPLKYGAHLNTQNVPYAMSRTNLFDLMDTLVAGFKECNLGWDPENGFDGVKIEWSDKVCPEYSTGNLNTCVDIGDKQIYNGIQAGATMKVAWRGKVYRTALVHELVHYFGKLFDGRPDPSHRIPEYWKCEQLVNMRLKERNL